MSELESEASPENSESSELNFADRKLDMLAEFEDPMILVQRIYQLWWNWADFHIYVISPYIESISPPIIIEPELISENEIEFVYPIQDRGDKLSTSKGKEMFYSGKSMCKLFFTIEKMVMPFVKKVMTVRAEPEERPRYGHQRGGSRFNFRGRRR